MDERITLTVVILCVLFSVGKAQDECDTLPIDSLIESNLQSLLVSEGGEDPSIDPNLLTVMYTCMALGMTMDSYREVSVIVTYNMVANNQPRQFDLQCVLSGVTLGWQGIGSSLDAAPSGFASLETRTDCSQCRRNANNDYDCVACHSDCNDGLMRCTGTGSTQCCPLFDNGMCATSCNQTNHEANEQNNFICSCGLTCDNGFVLDFDNCICNLNDICLAFSPCENGNCILNSPPDNYTCNCTGTGFMGTNCSVCGLSCEPGYTPDPTCSICDLINICEAETPCDNNGVCILGSQPDEYTCDCTNTGYTGTNCTVCNLSCGAGYIALTDCSKCIFVNTCEADTPCEINEVCILGSQPDEYTCTVLATNCSGSAREPSSDEIPVWAIVVISVLGFACVSLIIFVVILFMIMKQRKISGKKYVNIQTGVYFKNKPICPVTEDNPSYRVSDRQGIFDNDPYYNTVSETHVHIDDNPSYNIPTVSDMTANDNTDDTYTYI